ncbi:O-antigen polymerase [Candidatus Njordibacter sp. Uisw_056]|jgi:oligosaccharide repeat unit polymerase|uniref:O-antigen polymerase n=1 Tax=Candidatus Njordibacter sp. Uisw_056 TaxID=3230973 RepID=UPI003D3DBB8E
MKVIVDLLSSRAFFLLYFLLTIAFAVSVEGIRSNLFFELLQLTIIISAVILISKNPRFNLANSFYGFTLIFFGLYPLVEFKMGVIYWNGQDIDTVYYIATSIMVLLSLFMFQLGYMSKLKMPYRPARKKTNVKVQSSALSRNTFMICLLVLVVPCAYLLQRFNYNILALQFRGMSELIETVFIMEFFFWKPLIFNIIFLTLLIMVKTKSVSFLKVIFLFAFMLFFVGPLSMPRFLVFSLYVPLFFVLLGWHRKKDCRFIGAVFFGMVFAFPLMDLFRWFGVDDNVSFATMINLEYYFAGHFDAFQNFARIIILDVHTYGEQILGAFLFFIPRSFWVTKPVGTGFLLAEQAGLSFNNISLPLVAELYLDYSIPGIIIGFLLLGTLYRYIDNRALRLEDSLSLFDLAKLIAYAEFVCLQYYLLRGNLLACVAFSTAILTSVFVAYSLIWFFKSGFRFRYGIR